MDQPAKHAKMASGDTSSSNKSGHEKIPCVPNKLTVEELRDELRERNLSTSGLKPVLIERLTQSLQEDGANPYRMALGGSERRKRRITNKKEPRRDEFPSEEEFQLAWTRWRESRDNNNESVKRSRQLAKQKRDEQERLHREREQQNAQLERLVAQMRNEVVFLNKVLKTPELLDAQELAQLEDLLTRGMPPA